MDSNVDNIISQDQVNQSGDAGVDDVSEVDVSQQADGKNTDLGATSGGVGSFTDKFDPNKLPKELLPAYKQMQADYTRKTQEIASIKKFYDAYYAYQPLIDYLIENPQLLDKLAEIEESGAVRQSATQSSEQEQVEYPDDPAEFAKVLKEQAKNEAIGEIMNIMKQQQDYYLAQQALEEDIANAEQLDERLATDEEFSELVLNAVLADQDVLAGRKTFTQATKEAIEKVDAILKSKVEGEKQKLTKMAQERKSVYVPSSTGKVVDNSYPQSIHEAAKMAGII